MTHRTMVLAILGGGLLVGLLLLFIGRRRIGSQRARASLLEGQAGEGAADIDAAEAVDDAAAADVSNGGAS